MSNSENLSFAADAKTLRLGTRGSQLAIWQSNWVKEQLEPFGVAVELIQIKTEGDQKSGALAQIGGQGLFTQQLQVALVENRIDLAVHSLKDLPTADHPELAVTAIPLREDTSDAWVSNSIPSLEAAPQQAVIGTGSVRRAAQLRYVRPDLDIRDIRGNVDTRLQKLDDGQFDAIILASAGLKRLGLESRIRHSFTADQMMPAVGQGALGLETRREDSEIVATVSRLNHADSFHRAIAERSLLQALFAGCLAPVGASTLVDQKILTLTGVVLGTDGKDRIEATAGGPAEDCVDLGREVARQLFDQGAKQLLDAAR